MLCKTLYLTVVDADETTPSVYAIVVGADAIARLCDVRSQMVRDHYGDDTNGRNLYARLCARADRMRELAAKNPDVFRS